MKKRIEDDQLECLLEESFLKEAEDILAEVNEDISLSEYSLPEDFDAKMEQRILQYEKEQEQYANLSEEDKEALRIGREMQLLKELEDTESENSEEKTVKFRKKKSLKARLLVALVAVMVMGLGMTAFGDTPFITKLKKNKVKDREISRVDTSNDVEITNEQYDELELYQQMEEMFGSPVVHMNYMPEDSILRCSDIDNVLKKAMLTYDCTEGFFEYEIYSTFRNQSVGYDIEDGLVSEENIAVNGNVIKIKEYNFEEEPPVYVGQFEYNGLQYVLGGTIEKNELVKILKNLYFF